MGKIIDTLREPWRLANATRDGGENTPGDVYDTHGEVVAMLPQRTCHPAFYDRLTWLRGRCIESAPLAVTVCRLVAEYERTGDKGDLASACELAAEVLSRVDLIPLKRGSANVPPYTGTELKRGLVQEVSKIR